MRAGFVWAVVVAAHLSFLTANLDNAVKTSTQRSSTPVLALAGIVGAVFLTRRWVRQLFVAQGQRTPLPTKKARTFRVYLRLSGRWLVTVAISATLALISTGGATAAVAASLGASVAMLAISYLCSIDLVFRNAVPPRTKQTIEIDAPASLTTLPRSTKSTVAVAVFSAILAGTVSWHIATRVNHSKSAEVDGATVVEVSDSSGLAEVRRRADEGDPSAQLQLGIAYEAGALGRADFSEALKWYYRSARSGDARGMYVLGIVYLNGGDGMKKDPVEALKWLHAASLKGDAAAQFEVAKMYAGGTGVQRNDAEAFYWLQVAAEHGHPESQSLLGNFYQEGRGVIRNSVEAVKWWRRAAAQGSVSAAGTLADWEEFQAVRAKRQGAKGAN